MNKAGDHGDDTSKSLPGDDEQPPENDTGSTDPSDDGSGIEPTTEIRPTHAPIAGTPRWLLVAGSIVVPLVAAVAAFGGAIWGANSQTADNRETINAERDRLYDQFHLTQKQEQYAAIRQQATRLENASDFSTTGLALGMVGLNLENATDGLRGVSLGDCNAGSEKYQLGVVPNINYYNNPRRLC